MKFLVVFCPKKVENRIFEKICQDENLDICFSDYGEFERPFRKASKFMAQLESELINRQTTKLNFAIGQFTAINY